MKLSELFSVEKLEQYIEEGFVSKRKHPQYPLYILNYTASTQFAWKWDEITLNCRGLVIDEDYNIVARSLPKFFSYEQLEGKLPEGEFKVEEKMDGSMLLVFTYNGELITATRGSFESEQAIKAYEYLTPEVIGLPEDDGFYHPVYGYRFKSELTYIFEIIYPENKIVVNYPYEGLVLLGISDASGMEYDSAFIPFRRPRIYRFSHLSEILAYEEPNLEGFVLKYLSGERVKVKLAEYKRLHRLITGFNEKDVWEALKEGKLEQVLEEVPDEMYQWVRGVQNELETKFNMILETVKEDFVDKGDRKENALHYQNCKYPSVLFNMLDGKDVAPTIWKMVKPKVTQNFRIIGEDSN